MKRWTLRPTARACAALLTRGRVLSLAALLTAHGNAQAAGACSPYQGDVVINEVRVGKSNSADAKNQVEFFNTANIAPAVWQTWSVQVWLKDGTKASTRKGTYALSSGHTATGQFIYNNATNYWLQNKKDKKVDIALLDANGDFIAYLAIEGTAQTVPGCFGATTTVASSGNKKDKTGGVMRPTDGTGVWPSAVTETSVHTIGRTNKCSASGDLVISHEVDFAKPVNASTTVTYTVTAYNNACSTKVSGAEVTITNLSTTNFSARTLADTCGSGSGTGNIVWNVGDIAAGATCTFTFTGKTINLGTINSVASVTKPTTGLVNTGDDSDSVSITAYQFNFVGMETATDTATEGTDFDGSAVVAINVPSTKATTVNYTVGGTAGAGDHNAGTSGSVVIPAGDSSASIDFTITNDSTNEVTETISFTITSVTSTDTQVRIGTAGTGDILTETYTLVDDDPISVDHYELSTPSAAVSCLASTLTVTACADTSSPCTNAATTINGQTATLAASNGSLGSTSVTFNGSGVATTTLSWPAASNGGTTSVTLSGEQTVASNARKCCPNGSSCSVANSCTTTYSTAGFIVASAANGAAATVPSQVAGTSSAGYFLRAVQTNTSTKACESAITGVGNVSWSYQCNNPTTCSASNLMTLTGNAATTIARNNNGSSASTTAVAMTFDANGNAPFSFNYADVGQVTLNASRAASGSLLTTLSGATNAFVVRPGGFALSTIRQTAAPQLVNPAAASAAGAKFVKAGEAFSATVTATTSGGATTPNYGRETTPEGVLLTRTLVLPAGGATGTLSNGTIAGGSFTNGVATATNLAFSEVGIITLTPSVGDGSYLGAGDTTGTTTGNIGRFFPAQFALSSGSVTHRSALSCSPASAFSYLGENFRLGLTLTAQNAAGATTTNYTGSFAKLDPTTVTWNLAGRDATTVFTVASTRLSLGSATGSFSNGVASGITLTANAARATTPDGPFTATFGVAPVDSDGVAMAAFDMASASGGGNDRTQVASVPLRFGRLRVSSAAGAADRALALPVAAQSWNGSAFDTNTLDSCTAIATTAMSFGNLRGTLTTADTAASSGITVASGVGSLRLAAPGGGRSGTYDVALSLGSSATDASCLQSWTPGVGDAATAGANLAYLRGNFCASTYSNDPAARATFGRPRGVDSLVYRRENF